MRTLNKVYAMKDCALFVARFIKVIRSLETMPFAAAFGRLLGLQAFTHSHIYMMEQFFASFS